LVEYGAVQRTPRLERHTVPPVVNRALRVAGIALCVAAGVFWVGVYTVKDPGGGLVVIAVLLGLVGLGVGVERLLNRKARRMLHRKEVRRPQERAARQRALRAR